MASCHSNRAGQAGQPGRAGRLARLCWPCWLGRPARQDDSPSWLSWRAGQLARPAEPAGWLGGRRAGRSLLGLTPAATSTGGQYSSGGLLGEAQTMRRGVHGLAETAGWKLRSPASLVSLRRWGAARHPPSSAYGAGEFFSSTTHGNGNPRFWITISRDVSVGWQSGKFDKQ